jgi:hypothetical protein
MRGRIADFGTGRWAVKVGAPAGVCALARRPASRMGHALRSVPALTVLGEVELIAFRVSDERPRVSVLLFVGHPSAPELNKTCDLSTAAEN